MFRVQLFLKTGYSLGYLHKRGEDICLGGNIKNALVFTEEEFNEVLPMISEEYKIKKEEFKECEGSDE